jgi:hypothetical protein
MDGMTANHGRSAGYPGTGLMVEESFLTASQPSRAEGLNGRGEAWRGVA